MSSKDSRDKVRRAAGSIVRKGGAAREITVPSMSNRRVVSDAEQTPAFVTELVSQRGVAPDPYEDDPEARALALSPLLDGDRPFGLLRMGSEWLGRSGNEKLNFLLSLADPEATIQALAQEEFVFLAKDIGSADSAALLTLASPAQLQATVDLDAWRLDRMDRERFARWFTVCSQAGETAIDRFVSAQQSGVLTLFLAASVQVFENREDADEVMPEDAEIFSSPDGAFLLAADPNDKFLPVIRELLSSVYRIGVEHGRKIVRACRWELPTPLEEHLRDDRGRRVEGYGFMSRHEARQAYEPLDVATVRARLDASLADATKPRPDQLRRFIDDVPRTGLAMVGLDDGRLIGRALAVLDDNERARLEIGLTRLAYRVQSARAESSAEIDELSTWTRHALSTCDIGLAEIAGDRLEVAVAALRHLPVLELFRCGHGLTIGLHHSARRIRRALGGNDAMGLLDDDGADILRSLLQGMPERIVEGSGRLSQDGTITTRPFETLAEVQQVRGRLQRMRVAINLVTGLAGEVPLAAAASVSAQMISHTAGDLRLSSLVGTAIAFTVLDGVPKLEALTGAEVQKLLKTAFEDGPSGRKVRADLRAALTKALLSSPHVAEEDVTALEDVLELVLARFDAELGRLDYDKAVDPRFAGTAIAIKQ